MKAAWYTRNGPAGSVLEIGDKPTPAPGEGEVLVRLETSGVNPSDVKSRAGRPLAFDFIVPHSDGAGVIAETGKGVDPGRKGERVWIWNGAWRRQFGTAAEYICVPQQQAVLLPDAISVEVAACFGIPGLTAAHAVNALTSRIAAGASVLVTGAASSVGYYITQFASAAGYRVIGTASGGKHDLAREAGASEMIDYRSEPVAERLLELTGGQGVEAAIDMDFSGTSLLLGTGAIQDWGTVFCYGSNDMGQIDLPFRELLFRSLKLDFFLVYELSTEARQAAIRRLTEFAESGQLKTRIGAVLPLSEIAEAHRLVETGKAEGNVVLTL